ncbi:hypothetical protein N7462_009727 [Penicillium macrosclerotiorum]|uniref:uncharacterized protein n=1 Tax=Penicillium macrosclerotiorum TaxID=303699 RepID=UPI002548C326|nr:uncharacterized protein N7462_009727 [Penicillium macrosclerotiorum]KAJ5668657.1 hypothetical protein N7462_009727 [Penicillium macrosclerotiorum]
MPNSTSSGNVKTPKSRTKTFTGCWTCRARRVKCDDERPHCRRCRRSGWQCQGYGLRLGWSQTPGSRSHRRQIWSSTPQSTHDLSSAAVTALLADLDGCSGDGIAQQRGPFSVFSASTPSPKDPKPAETQYNVAEYSPLLVNRCISIPLVVNESSSRSGSSAQASPEPVHEEINFTITSPSTSCHEQWLSPRLSEEAARIDSDRIRTASAVGHRRPENGLSPEKNSQKDLMGLSSSLLSDIFPVMAINPIQLPRPETELVHHWVVFLSGNMLLIDTPDNPCRTIFMPMALKGLDAPPSEPNIHLSIFHAICASSAFSLFHLRRDPRYQSLAMHHDQLALRHLRENLQRAKRLDEPTLAAVLSCITAEAMSGRRSRWRAHVAGGLGLLENEIHGGWVRGPTASRLLQSYLSLSSLCSLPMSAQLMSLLNGPSELRHYLERSHGITGPLVQFLAHITSIIDSKSRVPTEELDKLELQLYLNFPCLSNPDAPGSIIIQHALNSFYYATIVYFRRTLRRAPLCDVQELVEKAIQELEAVDVRGDDKGGCAYNWASFVVAAECQREDLQARMLASFDRKSRHGIQNINVLCEIVQTLWQRRARAGPGQEIYWQEIAQEADFDIMLV